MRQKVMMHVGLTEVEAIDDEFVQRRGEPLDARVLRRHGAAAQPPPPSLAASDLRQRRALRSYSSTSPSTNIALPYRQRKVSTVLETE